MLPGDFGISWRNQQLFTLSVLVVVAQGLIDLAFDPDFSDNGLFYISHTINLGTWVSAGGDREKV